MAEQVKLVFSICIPRWGVTGVKKTYPVDIVVKGYRDIAYYPLSGPKKDLKYFFICDFLTRSIDFIDIYCFFFFLYQINLSNWNLKFEFFIT